MTATPPQEEISDDPAKKHRGRPKNQNFLSYEEARELMHAELIPSRGKYVEWWDREKPKTIPRFPYRVYTGSWISWNDFLGTSNKFNEKKCVKWRPYGEAVLWAHTRKIASYEAWLAYCKTGDRPDDIPARPDLVYKQWVSWGHWLGNRPVEAIQAKRQAERVAVFYVIHEHDVPSNVLTFGTEPMGMTALREWWEVEKFDVIKLFWHDQDRQDDVTKIINHFSSPYLGYDKQRLTPNVWDILYHLQPILELVKPT